VRLVVVPSIEQTGSWVADVVRAGLDEPAEVKRLVADAISADHPDLDAESTAAALIVIAMDSWLGDASTWPEVTDHDRLQQVFEALADDGIAVLQGCADHWAARDLLAAEPSLRGVVWFTPPDVWHALDAGMLEVNLWHGSTANAAPGDQLLDEVLERFSDAGLAAHFDEGRIEVSAFWQRKPPAVGDAHA
jgi:hypothetical protein